MLDQCAVVKLTSDFFDFVQISLTQSAATGCAQLADNSYKVSHKVKCSKCSGHMGLTAHELPHTHRCVVTQHRLYTLSKAWHVISLVIVYRQACTP